MLHMRSVSQVLPLHTNDVMATRGRQRILIPLRSPSPLLVWVVPETPVFLAAAPILLGTGEPGGRQQLIENPRSRGTANHEFGLGLAARLHERRPGRGVLANRNSFPKSRRPSSTKL